MFEVERLIEDCRAAMAEDPGAKAVREVAHRAAGDPAAVMKTLGEPKRAEIQKLHHTPALTILNVVWAPYMTLLPHNHNIWAVIAVYTGREDNIFWRRIPGGDRIKAAGAKDLRAGDAAPLGRDIIHSVTNPIPRLTGAIHIYGGDFFAPGRSEWDPETLAEQDLDLQNTLRRFEEANARFG